MYRSYIKYFIDTIFALIIGLLFVIPGLIIALLIKLSSKGPVFFKQERFGKESKLFTVYKFRTMTVDTPAVSNQTFGKIDNFITPVGRFLRTTSLDEIPQIINIIRGEMSFVGPRPLAKTDLSVIQARQHNGADTIKPGITGLAQVNGRNLLNDEEKATFDFDYSKNVSLKMDLSIIMKTFVEVLLRTGINSDRE